MSSSFSISAKWLDYSPWSALLFLVTSSVVVILSYPIYNLLFHPLRKIPGPKLFAATRIPSSQMLYSGEAPKKILELHRTYGDVVRISPDEISVMGEHTWDELMGHRKQGHGENGKDPLFWTTNSNSLVSASREEHGRLRKTLAHGFSAASIAGQEPVIASYVDLLLQKLKSECKGGKTALDMTSWYNWTTFDVIGDLAFGEPFGCLENSSYHPWVKMIFDRIKGTAIIYMARRWGWMQKFIVFLADTSFQTGFESHMNLTSEKLDQRAAMITDRPDYYHAMTNQPPGKAYTRPQLIGTSSSLIIAGSETTATTLSAATYFLGKNPAILQKLCNEVRTSFNSEEEITLQSVNRLNYMLAVFDETLRVYPPVPAALPRKMNEAGGIINGRWIPGGTSVGIWQYSVYHNPEYFALPDSFIPERWSGEDQRFKSDVKKAFQPFSVGPRNCIGRNLAYAEMRLILARIIWSFDISLHPDSEDWFDNSKVYTLWQKPTLNVHLTPRVGA